MNPAQNGLMFIVHRSAFIIAALLLATPVRADLTEKVACKDAPDQTYALFTPSSYNAAKHWPIVYILDARGRALDGLAPFRDAAEQLGFILASSYDSASDQSNEPNIKSMRAMWNDTHSTLSIDDKRVYAAGFSGTVRAACYLALAAPGSLKAIIGAGAGFPYDRPPASSTPFIFFGTIGTRDFNYGEMWELKKKLDAAGLGYRIVAFDGPHDWMPPTLGREVLQWLVTRNGDARFWDEDLARAEKTTDVIDREWRYAAMARDYAGIHDTSLVSARAKFIAESKEYKDAVMARDLTIHEEGRYLTNAQRIFAQKPPYDAARAIADLKIKELHARTDDSAKRLLNTLSAQAGFYLPRDMMAEKQYDRAIFFLTIAKAINPESKYLDDQIASAKKLAASDL
jgi:predicted esterase